MTRKSVSQSLRQAVRDFSAKASQNELARRSGVHQAVISRFASGQREVTTRALDPLCEALGLELRPIQPARKSRKTRRA